MTREFDGDPATRGRESLRLRSWESGDRTPLDMAREAFRLLVTGPEPLGIDGGGFPGLAERLIPLDELRDMLLEGGCPEQTRSAVWVHLVRRSHTEGAAWTIACVGLALPGIARIARGLAQRYRGERAELESALLTGFVEELRLVDPSESEVLPGRLLWAVYRAGHAEVVDSLHAAIPTAPDDLPIGEDGATPTAPGFRSSVPQLLSGHPDLVLARAVADGALHPEDAELIGTTRLDGVDLTAWAHRRGMRYDAANHKRWRAEQHLISYLSQDRLDRAAAEDPVAPQALTRTALTTKRQAAPAPQSSRLSTATSTRGRSQKKRIATARVRKTRKNRSSPS